MSLNDPLLPSYPTSTSGTPSPAWYRPLRGLGTASVVLVALTCVISVIDGVVTWYAYGLADDYVNGTGVTYDDLLEADRVSFGIVVVLLVGRLAAGVVFLVWLWRARMNAELVDPTAHRMARGWTIGGWFCPVVNLWFPLRIVHDIWQASRPADLLVPGRPVRWWWTAWVLTWVTGLWLRSESRSDEVGLDQLRDIAVANTAVTVFDLVAGVFLIMVIRQITAWQSAPPPR